MSNKPKNFRKGITIPPKPQDLVGQLDCCGREIIAQSNITVLNHFHSVYFVASDEELLEPFYVDFWVNEDDVKDLGKMILVLNTNHSFYNYFLSSSESAIQMAMKLLSAIALSTEAVVNNVVGHNYTQEQAQLIMNQFFKYTSIPLLDD